MKAKVYSTSTCPHCIDAKKFLKEKKVDFENIDVGKDEKAAKEMMEKTGQMGVPVIEIDGEIVVGFDEAKISKLLGLK